MSLHIILCGVCSRRLAYVMLVLLLLLLLLLLLVLMMLVLLLRLQRRMLSGPGCPGG